MSTMFKDANITGVIISRIQVQYLTDSHVRLIKSIQDRHNKLLILLGVTDKINPKNPLSFDIRRQMIAPLLRVNDMIMPIKDVQDDNPQWVKNVDNLVDSTLYVNESAMLYGGRDSFIPYYRKDNGKYPTQELLPEDNDSGTELRNLATTKIPVYSRAVAEAIIYTVNNMSNGY